MITILCAGTRGDFQPYIALAQELRKLGKDVRITGGNSFEDFIKNYGIGFYPVSIDYKSNDIDPKMLKAAQSSDNPLKMLLSFNKMKEYVLEMTEEMYYACAGSELIIYHPGCSIGYFAGEILNIPSVLAAPIPMHKTKEFASVISYGKTKMPVKLSHALFQSMLWMIGKTAIAAFLKDNGKQPKTLACPFEKVDKQHPAIISCSNHVFPRPSDWNENIHQYGYWFVEEDDEYKPSKELSEFLKKGEKPVYVGFGSVYNSIKKNETVKLIIDAMDKCGKRCIISGMGDVEGLPDNIIAIGSIPHSWLFERVSAVCHHGGSGTTAAGLMAGVPGIIVPFSNDQFAWAHRVFELGVGSKPIYRKKLTSERLAAAIEFALGDNIAANAKALGKKIADEKGAGECAEIIVKRLEMQRC